MAKKIQTLIEEMFAGVEAKDVDAAVAPMADDIALHDIYRLSHRRAR